MLNPMKKKNTVTKPVKAAGRKPRPSVTAKGSNRPGNKKAANTMRLAGGPLTARPAPTRRPARPAGPTRPAIATRPKGRR